MRYTAQKKFSYSWWCMIIGAQMAYVNTEYRMLR